MSSPLTHRMEEKCLNCGQYLSCLSTQVAPYPQLPFCLQKAAPRKRSLKELHQEVYWRLAHLHGGLEHPREEKDPEDLRDIQDEEWAETEGDYGGEEYDGEDYNQEGYFEEEVEEEQDDYDWEEGRTALAVMPGQS